MVRRRGCGALNAQSEDGTDIQIIPTLKINNSVVTDEKDVEVAVRILHKAFERHQEVTRTAFPRLKRP